VLASGSTAVASGPFQLSFTSVTQPQLHHWSLRLWSRRGTFSQVNCGYKSNIVLQHPW